MAPTTTETARRQALDVLLDPQLEPIVELVVERRNGAYEAHAVDGHVQFRRTPQGAGWAFEVEAVDGRNPLADQATDRFAGLEAERTNLHPKRTYNAYPHAYEQVAQLFDAPHAPDLCVLHTAAHNWADQGGHLGEHGSMGAIQARAPFVIAGAGVRRLGRVPRSARLVDVTATVATLLGSRPGPGVGLNGLERPDAVLARQDGEPLDDLLDGERPRHVVGFLLDGCNPNVLYAMADRGDAPNIARLMALGTTFEHGAVSSLPTVTLANHTSIITGLHPGHHGILHNAWWDRERGEQVVTNSPTTWATAMSLLAPGTDSLHLAARRADPESFTASVNEPADHGAGFSTFDLLRRGVRSDFPRSPDDLPHATERFVRPFKDYAWYSRVDHNAVQQAAGLWRGSYLDVAYPRPRFLWVNFTLTDTAFHEGGPHSEIAEASIGDTDGRIGDILEVMHAEGTVDDTAFFLVADHGMELTDPTVTGDWDVALRRAGVPFRDEGYGFVYLNP